MTVNDTRTYLYTYILYVRRTRAEINVLSHTTLGAVCPGCNLKIVEQVTNKETQVKLAKLGDEAPPVPKALKAKGVTHLSLHRSVVHGQRVVFHLEPCEWTTCLLHLDLIQKGALLQKTLIDEIGKVKVAGEKTSQSQVNDTHTTHIVANTRTVTPIQSYVRVRPCSTCLTNGVSW